MFCAPRRARALFVVAAGLAELHQIATRWARRPSGNPGYQMGVR